MPKRKLTSFICKRSSKKSKKRKFKRPRAGLKGLVSGNRVSYVGYQVHGTGVYDDTKYTVLTCTQVSETDRTYIESILKPIITGGEVMNLADGTNGWCVQKLDAMGRAYLVLYKGIECSLFFKRQVTELKLLPGDRHPESVLKDPRDVWQRLDLLGKSAKQSNIVLKNEHDRLKEENNILQIRIKTLEELNGRLETQASKSEDIMSWFTPKELSLVKKRIKKNEKRQLYLLQKKKERIAKELEAKKKKRRRRRK